MYGKMMNDKKMMPKMSKGTKAMTMKKKPKVKPKKMGKKK